MTVRTTIDIEDLVRWTYAVQCADAVIGSGIGLYQGEAWVDGVGRGGHVGYGFDSCTLVRRAGVLGCRIDRSGGGRGDLHPDAEAVHEAVAALRLAERDAGSVVLQCGLAGVRPGWAEGAWPRWEPVWTRRRANGEVAPVYDYDPGYRGGQQAWYCPLRFVDGPESIDYQRRVYAAWHVGLVWLVGELSANRGRLIRYVVTGPAAPAAPWKARNYTGFQTGVDRPAENR